MADNRIYLSSQPLIPVGSTKKASPRTGTQNSAMFADILDGERKRVNFSQHAIQRLRERSLDLSDQQLDELGATVERMAKKGARESLIYMDDIALIVSVANRMVITAMDGPSAKENIFTNIDSAAIL